MSNKQYPADHYVPALIFPKPLNQEKYVALNIGFTYHEYACLNNARQVPMLPDRTIIDLRTPAGSQYPEKLVCANFFEEFWRLKLHSTFPGDVPGDFSRSILLNGELIHEIPDKSTDSRFNAGSTPICFGRSDMPESIRRDRRFAVCGRQKQRARAHFSDPARQF